MHRVTRRGGACEEVDREKDGERGIEPKNARRLLKRRGTNERVIMQFRFRSNARHGAIIHDAGVHYDSMKDQKSRLNTPVMVNRPTTKMIPIIHNNIFIRLPLQKNGGSSGQQDAHLDALRVHAVAEVCLSSWLYIRSLLLRC
jgi:hypothetical protein